MKLFKIILLALSFVAAVIGVHRSYFADGLAANYWLFMLSIVFFMLYRYVGRRSAS
ncbi:MAG: hypothetical protein LPK19_13580 [Hymenobacteraceae bacterium]|nr:hypothetical protein [Hymenobacteraceae bacterium]MDX5397256.1 hypothetical protein [Hymenobacteraceae bacterium]MDX5513334.1 hypothetical protein [Hymenobacteraceae bacterium]